MPALAGTENPTFDAAEQRGRLSDERFTVDGTLIDVWASLKSFTHKDCAEGLNWRANSFRRPPLTNQLDDPLSELRRVRRWLFGIVDLPFYRNDGVSTKRGQLHT